MHDDAARATREKVVLALIPSASLHELRNPQSIVAIASELCQYIHQLPERSTSEGRPASGTTPQKGGPKPK
jgi:hypothetical protein